MKLKTLHCVNWKINKIKNTNNKRTRRLPPTHHKTLYFPCFLLLCNAVILVKNITVLQFKRKFHYIIYQEGNFSPLPKKKKI